MEVRQIMKALLRRWWLVLLPALVVGGYTVLTYTPPATTYQVGMRFATGTESADALSEDYDRYYAWLTSEYVANGLADVVGTLDFAENVAERLADDHGLMIPAAALQGAFAGDNTQSITVIYVTWANPDEIVSVANAVSAELLENAGVYYPQMAGVGDVARRLDDPLPVAQAPSLRAQLTGPALRVMLALVLGAGLALLVYIVDPRVYESAELEDAGLPVLAEIPQ